MQLSMLPSPYSEFWVDGDAEWAESKMLLGHQGGAQINKGLNVFDVGFGHWVGTALGAVAGFTLWAQLHRFCPEAVMVGLRHS